MTDRTYLYEVTSTQTDGVPVGALLADTAPESRRGEPRTWTLYRPGHGLTPGWSGVCLHRICAGCRTLGTLRAHRHPGSCGPCGYSPLLTPARITFTAPTPDPTTEDPHAIADAAPRLAAILDEEPQP